MHESAMFYGRKFFDAYYPKSTKDEFRVVEIGSQNVNGSLREVCPSEVSYVGLDFIEGDGVDIVITDPYQLPLENNSADIVVSSSCFEHSELFWLVFLEVLRILKPGGIFYLNVPSNGFYHQWPVDCWRFYPDSGHALELWGNRNGFDVILLESFIGRDSLEGVEQGGKWNDFVAVFLKDRSFLDLYQERILTTLTDYYNGYSSNVDGPLNYESRSPDFALIEKHITLGLEKDNKIKATELEVLELERQIRDYSIQSAKLYDQSKSLGNDLLLAQAMIPILKQEVLDRESQINSLQDRYNKVNNTLNKIYSSKVWRVLAPIRWYGLQRRRVIQFWLLLRGFIKVAGGLKQSVKLCIRTWQYGGGSEVLALARNYQKTKSLLPEYASKLQNKTGQNSESDTILFVSHEASRTGAPIFLLELIKHVSSRLKLDCILILCSGGSLDQEFRDCCTTIALSTRHHIHPTVLDTLRHKNIKLIYSSTITNGLIQKELSVLGCPVLCHVHELPFSIQQHFGGENLKAVLDTTSLFLAGSKVVASSLHEYLHVPYQHIRLSYPFISVNSNQQQIQCRKPELELPKNALVVGACGTIGWRKGTDIFLQVARRVLSNSSRNIAFVWVGGAVTNVDYNNLIYDAKMLGIDDHIIFTGMVESHLPYFSRFDIFILPSREDPFPLVVLDAASLEIPIICFDKAGGAPELVEDDAGLVVPYLDIDQMSDAVSQLIEDESARHRLGERAYQKVLERHDIAVGGEQIVEIINSFLNKQPSVEPT